MKDLKSFSVISVLIFLAAYMNLASATLILTIDTYTTDELSFTISGTFASNTVGSAPGFLALKNNWSNNKGIHTELFDTVDSMTSTIQFDGQDSGFFTTNLFSSEAGDNIVFGHPDGSDTVFAAGTVVSGAVTLLGVDAFDPGDFATLELVSGYTSGTNWERLEANAVSAVPVPAAVWLMGSALAGLFGFSRRKSTTA